MLNSGGSFLSVDEYCLKHLQNPKLAQFKCLLSVQVYFAKTALALPLCTNVCLSLVLLLLLCVCVPCFKGSALFVACVWF